MGLNGNLCAWGRLGHRFGWTWGIYQTSHIIFPSFHRHPHILYVPTPRALVVLLIQLTEHMRSGKTPRAKDKRTLRVIITSTSASFAQVEAPPELIPVSTKTKRERERASCRTDYAPPDTNTRGQSNTKHGESIQRLWFTPSLADSCMYGPGTHIDLLLFEICAKQPSFCSYTWSSVCNCHSFKHTTMF